MTTDAELTAKLARLGARVAAAGARARARLAEIGALALAEAARETFGAKLVWLRDEHGEIGTEPEAGQRWDLDVRPTPRVAEIVAPVAAGVTARRRRRKARPVPTWHDRCD